ncbi:MAG TPA: prepilin-type N-terminal cleavage/methylation domain-containing protein [Vicinamibacteria bacterium]|nr:prepilin-type N-terminal cleavage/methylation domain-containing protein [Vicinamibacteria bacterium]
MSCSSRRSADREGFTLIEVLVAMLAALIVLASVFALLAGSQDSFRRENEVADTQMSTRAGMVYLTRDLSTASYRTPPMAAILWNDGGGINPDEVTIISAHPDYPTCMPMQCGNQGQGRGGGPCGTIDQSSVLRIEPDSMEPSPLSPETAYSQGMVLTAIETGDCNQDGLIGFYPFEVTQPPRITNAGGQEVLQINHNPGKSSGMNPPGGFNREIREDCALIGLFRVITYRVSPAPPDGNSTLERRDLSAGPEWVSVADNIENLQVRYGVGNSPDLVDLPSPPNGDPATWIHRVQVSITGRSESTNLKGASAGVFDPADTYLRRTISSTVSLRNVVLASENFFAEGQEPPVQP